MSLTYLVSDTREHHVHASIETLFDAAGAEHTVAQINTGDYLICRRFAGGQPTILAVIERKTHKDFAASFKDGRYENRLKMLDLRDKTGCQLYYFVEGPAYPKPTWKVARIPYGNILTAMTHLMIRDGVHVVQTENEMGTAQRLLDFVRGFGSTDVPYTYRVDPGGDAAPSTGDAAPGTGVPELVMGTIEKSDSLLAVEMWTKLTGISIATAQVIVDAFSVADLVSGSVTVDDLDALRTRGGRQLVKKGKASLRALRRGAQKEGVKILSGVPGISPAMAAQILVTGGADKRAITLLMFLSYEPAMVAGTIIQQKGREVRLGAARAERVHRLMNYSTTTIDAGEQLTAAPLVIAPEQTLNDDDLDILLGL